MTVDEIKSLVVAYADKRMMVCLNKAPESHEDAAWANLVTAVESMAADAARFSFIANCEDIDAALDLLAEEVGCIKTLTELVDALIEKSKGEAS